ncbi:DNA-3-methyladenine glycosylase I [Candidatus Dojkabacteria bacterium]|uniref:DNA-3-methyladenine glycosylase I n=1 Tax=Candidatus Dojkabacteria bacterium TaxID=2099670 RepID=A0A955RJQ7_9BACT|nr:DNA-3-methyladenine glycosylase I [Candidatus Dojkabacteria bacterium]
MEKNRCTWCGDDPLYQRYHDEEWGVPVYDDQKLFEFLVLEGAQAGLSWITILRKRDAYREAFDGFDYKKIANYSQKDEIQLLKNAGIVRNKLKVRSAIINAQMVLKIQREFGSFSNYIWSFVGGEPMLNSWEKVKGIPVSTNESERLSKDLKKRGFKFVGPTIMYAFMQAVGMVNDHTTDCFRYNECKIS